MKSYSSAGVSIDEAAASRKKIKRFVESTFNKTVICGFGSFGGAIDASFLKKMKKPVLVSTIDGVGTKVKVAAMAGRWDTVGADIVNHSSNDILALGARPIFFLDYLAFEKLDKRIAAEILKGMSSACRKLDCPIAGGETAQMPQVYRKKEIDIAGCMVGVVEKSKLIDGSKIRQGDALVGLASSGLHTNGYSLARKVLLKGKPGKKILAELLRVHKSYSKNVLLLSKKVKVKGIVHVTGGGIAENSMRILPKGFGVKIDKGAWNVPKIFGLIREKGKVDEKEMFRVFNMGIGLVLVVSEKDAKKTVSFMKSRREKAFLIGKVIKDSKKRVLFYG